VEDKLPKAKVGLLIAVIFLAAGGLAASLKLNCLACGVDFIKKYSSIKA
jgi:hypothetical protein